MSAESERDSPPIRRRESTPLPSTAAEKPRHEAAATSDELRAQDWGAVRARVFAAAFAMSRSRSRAEELADTVLNECIDPLEDPWRPDERPDLVAHAFRVLKNRLSAERRKQLVRSSPRTIAMIAGLAPDVPTPFEELDRARRQESNRRIVEAARARLKDPLDHAILRLLLDEIDKPAEQAAELKRDITDIRRARERLTYALRAATEHERLSHETLRRHPGQRPPTGSQ